MFAGEGGARKAACLARLVSLPPSRSPRRCARKIMLIGLPIFFEPGSSWQLILGLVICFISYGLYGLFGP